jgi:hypothetical protein
VLGCEAFFDFVLIRHPFGDTHFQLLRITDCWRGIHHGEMSGAGTKAFSGLGFALQLSDVSLGICRWGF